jgi:hypothetical protein
VGRVSALQISEIELAFWLAHDYSNYQGSVFALLTSSKS